MASYLDGVLYAQMLRAGGANLRTHAKSINDLNVFPIPDGDTGDNMLLTVIGGSEAIKAPSKNLGDTARRIADGMLLSARGNSGVILSQFFEGIAIGFEGLEKADCTQIASAFNHGVIHAYNAVMEPCEGTILTVVKEASEYTGMQNYTYIEDIFNDFISEANNTLQKTPDMLPVLKKAGVVDSGGAGLIKIFEGMKMVLSGSYAEDNSIFPPMNQSSTHDLDLDLFTEDSELEFGYCTELLLRLQNIKTNISKFDVSLITDYLQTIGNSVAGVRTGTVVKIHVHTMTPDKVLAFCQQYGEFLKVKIENMSLQHNNISSNPSLDISQSAHEERKSYAVVSVCSGEGIKQLFKDRGADVIVDGGQSMNPSAEEFLEAFGKANADTIIVFPNNGNIILAAKQAAGMFTSSDVRVIENKTVGDGYVALCMLDTDSGNTDEIVESIYDAMSGVITAEISKSIRDTDEVKSGDYIGFVGKDIICSDPSRLSVACDLLKKLSLSDYDICILIRGASVPEDETDAISSYIKSHYRGKEIFIVDGNQEIYDYIIILE